MYIIIAIGKIEKFPIIPDGETLHIISTQDSTIPVSVLAYNKSQVILHMLEKRSDNLAIAMQIGIIAKDQSCVKVLCPTDAIVKAFNGISADGVTVEAILATQKIREKKSTEKRPEKEKGDNKEIKEEVKTTEPRKRRTKEEIKSERRVLLLEKGVPEELVDISLEAVDQSSDPVIGLAIQLKTKLATLNAIDKEEYLLKLLQGLYKQIKK